MNSISMNQFQSAFNTLINKVITTHTPLKVTQNTGDGFIVINAKDWERDQETLYILQNTQLMQQISDSLKTHQQRKGYKPTQEQLNEIISV
ncbi:type II toxin-antitoxin system Phd/YefM family antitoxin [Candidatus Albibeggiatoa sp. nov. BB20]|uniref:type II toxin-antitoxin system Phd/YefM family antitoxin n=1 Tax=Candidatus Albibeggiatoa sp. nov. BB20 TaxID=3162723 RepID=UPI0033659D8F